MPNRPGLKIPLILLNFIKIFALPVIFSISFSSYALQPARVQANVIGVFTRAADLMDCDIAGEIWGFYQDVAYCYAGKSIVSYKNIAERSVRVVDHYKGCSDASLVEDSNWTTGSITIPPELHEYFTSVTGFEDSRGKKEYRLLKISTPNNNYDQSGNLYCNHDIYRYVLGNAFTCPEGSFWSESDNACIAGPVFKQPPKPLVCKKSDGDYFGNPISPGNGEKIQVDVDVRDEGPNALHFQRIYRSSWGVNNHTPSTSMGNGWMHNYAGSLVVLSVPWGKQAGVTDNDGYENVFDLDESSGSWISQDKNSELVTQSDGSYAFRYKNKNDRLIFDSTGRLIKNLALNGWEQSYVYDANGNLSKVTNNFGNQLAFTYDGKGLLSQVDSSDGLSYSYTYDKFSRLTSVIAPDTTSKTYLYENLTYLYALTGIVDENSARLSSFGYDADGRAISTQNAGGVNAYQASYAAGANSSVSDPLGTTRSYVYKSAQGFPQVTQGTLASASGVHDAANRVLDTGGHIASEVDFNGITSDFSWDALRGTLLSQTRASNRPEAQTTTTQWHPDFNLPVLVTESGRTTAYTYDPLGNRLSETITDTATGQARTRSWTYDAAGLVATATEPNGAVTSFVYDSAGNVARSTDALGRVTTYAHDAAGRLTQQTDPTGTVSRYTYDLRGRLLTQDRGGLVTTSTYTPTGLVSRIAYPNGYVANYTYDAAHRLTGWRDNRGAAGSFTLDGMGNRTAEQTLDAQGTVAWQVARSINEVNRVASETRGLDQTVRYTYDANGERVSETNALGQTTQYGLDGLRRVQRVTDSLNAQATLAYDPRDNVVAASDFKGVPTTYTRDAQGSATQERSADTGALATTYDALGLPQKIVDALGRATDITRDALGRPTRIQYADGTASVLGYDLAGADYAEADAPNAGIGFLGELQDPGVTTRWRHDALGRVTRKQQVLADSGTRSVGYGYGAAGAPGAGQIASIAYPSGGVLGYVYDATGQLTALTWNNTPLVSNLAWNPLGQPTGWQWPFVNGGTGSTGGLAASRRYNTAGQLVQYELGSYTWDAAGRVARLTQELMLPTANGVAPTVFTTGFTYDGAGRIVGMAHEPRTVASLPSEVPLSAVVGPQQVGMSYDANGNRQSVVYTQGAADSGLTLQRTYSVAPDSNRLTGYTQTLHLGTGDPTVTQVPFAYDATGSITQAGQDLWGYGADGRLRSVERSGGSGDTAARATYLHNALGQRVLKTNGLRTPAVRTETVYAEGPFEGSTVLGQYRSAADGLASTSSTNTTEFIYLPTASGPMPIAAVIDGRLYTVHSDHLNTPRRLTRDDGLVAWQWVTTAFGEVPPSTSATDFVQDAAVASSGAPPSSSAASPFAFDLRYPGQVADEESGLFYNFNRSYDPTTGRYTQNDPIGMVGGWSRVLYVGGNPLSMVDPMGLMGQGSGSNGGFFIRRTSGSCKCPTPPNMPQSANTCEAKSQMDKNIDAARNHFDPRWYWSQMEAGGPWDYKKQGPYEDFGNFNYGAVAASYGGIGLPGSIIRRFAGFYQEFRTPRSYYFDFGHFWGDYPYGDNPNDQYWVGQGIQYANCRCGS